MPISPRLTVVGLVCFMAALPALAATPPPVRIQPARIDAVFKAYDSPSSPGCALGIYQDGRVLYSKGYGMADLNQATPITPKTLFDVGSVSKQFAAASIVLLANDGKLALTDDIRKYLPEIPDYGTPITVDHLLHHTSGLRDYNQLLHLKGYHYEDVTDDDDALEVIARQRALRFKPGTRFEYSNTGYFLAALIVKRVTGKTLAAFAKERLFQPLGMTRSHFRDDHTAIMPGRATAYAPSRKEKGGYQLDMSNWNQLGDGQVQTSITELVKWEENFYSARVGGRALIDAMQERGVLNTGDSTRYGRGLFLDTYRGLQRVQHSGSWGGYRALLTRYPAQHVSIAVLCNRADARPNLADEVADVVLADAFRAAEPRQEAKAPAPATPSAPEPAPTDVGRYAGLYYDEAAQRVVRLLQENSQLQFSYRGSNRPLRAVGGERFQMEGAPLFFAFAHGKLTLIRGEETLGVLERVQPVTLSGDDWKPLVGTYYSPELETTWRIELKDGKAVLKGRAVGTHPLEPTFADAFNTDAGFLRVTRDGAGRPTGFVFSDLRFERKER
ncbi:beta-lactamase family protein [Pyxidicoccus fallax]|uniref:Beta-lactamase family protein n=1 Tax=Pyxidicoccus fallax TaxID=394095 RepID=A0A848LXN3_9BACT|nr:serine hydrolase domain-containing protein [Pyxidicoccus fallax]NMO22143.1 beta-lactamase family protein [Pyxidicoccus fallax]NPC83720.1 beta-lactamase family protein [Pyxidicoccus fallax]